MSEVSELPICARLSNARMMVNYGHGDVRDEPDPLHEEAAAIITELVARLSATTAWLEDNFCGGELREENRALLSKVRGQ